MVKIGPADGVVVGSTGHEILAEVVAHIQIREPAEIFLLGLHAALEAREFRNAEGVGRDGERLAVGTANHAAARVALKITRRIRQRSFRGEVGLLHAHSAHELQAPVQQRHVAPQIGGRDDLVGVFRVIDVILVGRVFIDGEKRRPCLVKIPQFAVAVPLGGGKAERERALREHPVEHRTGTVVARTDGRGGGEPVGTDESEGNGGLTLVAHLLLEIEAPLERDRHAPGEIAPRVRIHAALHIYRAVVFSGRRRERVAIDVKGIDRHTRGALGHGDAAGAQVTDVFKRHGHAGASGDGGVEVTVGDIVKVRARARVAGPGIEFPDRTVVPVNECGHKRNAVAVARRGREANLALAGQAARERRTEISGRDAVDEIGERVVARELAERDGLKRERDATVLADPVVEGGTEGIARGLLGEIGDGVLGEIGLVRRRIGKSRTRGGERGAAPQRRGERGRLKLGRGASGEREAEAAVHRCDVGKVEPRVDLARTLARGDGAGARGLREIQRMTARQQVGTHVQRRLGPLERGAGHHVDGAGERPAGRLRGGRVRDLDAREIVRRGEDELDVAVGIALRARETEAVYGDRHVIG